MTSFDILHVSRENATMEYLFFIRTLAVLLLAFDWMALWSNCARGSVNNTIPAEPMKSLPYSITDLAFWFDKENLD